ncbi:hypothetical protein [Chromobacterium sp. Beijing]|uniref:hypothetical protein n=1 Tax=Chromobacterium sp. Beijing TaxID=2735795 RepID=UPI001F3E57C3|nr:hypothetical protein [Chromobacterium sp. Beijing]UJB31013.1 hypothetical protein HQN78_08035 [Chromobacterium sp. Beijing]
MSNNQICELCQSEILSGQPRFYFPRLPPNHALADIKGVLHTSCLLVADNSRNIGASLAQIAESVARHSESAPHISRNGNVTLRNRLDEGRIEVLDFEDFCEISIPLAALDRLRVIAPGASVSLGMQVLHVKADGQLVLEHKSPAFDVHLSALSLERLQAILADIDKVR